MENEDIKEIRQHIVNCLIEKQNHLHHVADRWEDYKIKLKTWCITLFMVSAGFCLKENFRNFTWILPFAPVIIFWFLHSYREYFEERYYEPPEENRILNVLSEIYDYSLDDLKKEGKKAIAFRVSWKGKGDWILERGFEKIKTHIPKKFFSFENVFFFGLMFIVWLFVVIINGFIVLINYLKPEFTFW